MLRSEVSLGEKYAGKKVSRKSLDEEEQSSDLQAESEDESLNQADGDGDESEENDEEENAEDSSVEESQESNSHLRPKTLDEADKLQKELNQILEQERYGSHHGFMARISLINISLFSP